MGGSSAPAAPDYTPIASSDEADAQLEAQTADQQMAWSQQQFAANQAEINPLISEETQSAASQNADAQASYNRYTGTEVPLQNQYLAQAEDYANPAYQQQQAGQAVANTDEGYIGARAQNLQQMSSYGVDPGTARAGAVNSDLGSEEAASKAAAATSSTQNTRLTGLNLESNAENMMSGLAGQSTEEYGGANSAGQTASGNALSLTASGANTMGTAASWSGLQQSALNNWGNTLSSSYQSQLGEFQANQSASSGIGSIIGGIGGAAMGAAMMFSKGGAIPRRAQRLAHGGMAIPDNVSYARGGPVMPRVTKVQKGNIPHTAMKVFKPHLMTNVHPHTASVHAGGSAGGSPRMSMGMSRITGMRDDGLRPSAASQKGVMAPGAGPGGMAPTNIDGGAAGGLARGGQVASYDVGGNVNPGQPMQALPLPPPPAPPPPGQTPSKAPTQQDKAKGFGDMMSAGSQIGQGIAHLDLGGTTPGQPMQALPLPPPVAPPPPKAGGQAPSKAPTRQDQAKGFGDMMSAGSQIGEGFAHLAEGGAIPMQNGDPHGRADNLAMQVKPGAYIIPHSVVAKLGTHALNQMIVKDGDLKDKMAAHAALMGHHVPVVGNPGQGTDVNLSGGEFIMPHSVVARKGHAHFDKLVAQHGDATDRAAAEARLKGAPAGRGEDGPPPPASQLRNALPTVNLRQALPAR